MNNFLHCADNKDALRVLDELLGICDSRNRLWNRVKLVWGKHE